MTNPNLIAIREGSVYESSSYSLTHEVLSVMLWLACCVDSPETTGESFVYAFRCRILLPSCSVEEGVFHGM